MASKIRMNFHSDSEAMINKQINLELFASYTYMAMVSSLFSQRRHSKTSRVLEISAFVWLYATYVIFIKNSWKRRGYFTKTKTNKQKKNREK